MVPALPGLAGFFSHKYWRTCLQFCTCLDCICKCKLQVHSAPCRPFSIASRQEAKAYAPTVTNLTVSKKKSENSQRQSFQEVLASVVKTLCIASLDDWYDVPKYYVTQYGGSRLFRSGSEISNMRELLQKAYPQHTWEAEKLVPHSAKLCQQKFMERMIRQIFPFGVTLERNNRSVLISYATGFPIEIDCYLPEYKLGFEFQESHHYFTSHFGTYTLSEYKLRDEEKKLQALEKGVTLIYIPFWWNFDRESLISTIKLKRPDLSDMLEVVYADPIPEDPPQWVAEKFDTTIPDVGNLMLATHMPTSFDFDPTGWLIFEKYDGIRAVWHPVQTQFYSRFGNVIPMPKTVKDEMPAILMDGELWFGRDNLSEARKLSARAELSAVDWHNFVFIVFDLVDFLLSYEERHKILTENMRVNTSKFVKIAEYFVCESRSHLESIYKEITENGGEGIVIRRPNSKYLPGRSKSLLKFKGYRDADALLQQKISDRLWRVRIPKKGSKQGDFVETEMLVEESCKDTSDWDEGDIASYKYIGFVGKVSFPLNPLLYRVRKDLTWKIICDTAVVKQHTKKPHQAIQWKAPQVTWEEKTVRRRFFDEFAKSFGFDPLVEENWYKVTQSAVRRYKGGGAVINYYSGSHIKAIVDLYPELDIERDKFVGVAEKLWKDPQERLKFFMDFARGANFDPLDPQNWYTLTWRQVQNKGGSGLLSYHDNSHVQALIDLFPTLQFEKEKFVGLRDMSWKDERKRREFFDKIAEEKDVRTENDWYTKITRSDVVNRGGRWLLTHHQGSHIHAILDLYPELHLRKEGFYRYKIRFKQNEYGDDDEFARKKQNYSEEEKDEKFHGNEEQVEEDVGDGEEGECYDAGTKNGESLYEVGNERIGIDSDVKR